MFESITIHTIDRNGWPVTFNLQPGQKPGPALQWLEDHGYAPAAGPAAAPAYEIQPSPAVHLGDGDHANLTIEVFPAETMTATVDDGKVYWKVRGGPFRKFGLIAWPEVLRAAGFNPDAMDPLKPVDLIGWQVFYATGDEGRKIIELRRPTPA